MYNISTFRARYGSDIERIDYTTPEGTRSIFHVTVTGESKDRIYVTGTETDESGGHTVTRQLLKSTVTVHDE